MFWFISGLVVNSIAILLVIANHVYDSITLEYGTSHNEVVNMIGFVLAILVVVAFVMKTNGNLSAANVILWIPGAPLLFLGIVFGGYMLIIFLTKPDWK